MKAFFKSPVKGTQTGKTGIHGQFCHWKRGGFQQIQSPVQTQIIQILIEICVERRREDAGKRKGTVSKISGHPGQGDLLCKMSGHVGDRIKYNILARQIFFSDSEKRAEGTGKE